jgi:phosphomevalonate kinase
MSFGPLVRLTAPANLLLLGEYAVTEPGGLGIWLAPNIRATAELWPTTNQSSHITCRLLQSESTFALDAVMPPIDSNDPNALAKLVYLQFQAWLITTKLRPIPKPFQLIVDTRAFFGPDGQKLGYGSSAVASLLISAALVEAHLGDLPFAVQNAWRSEVPYLAIQAQRAFQGGHGSGYDVAASWLGGCGWFVGGPRPYFERFTAAWPFGVQLFQGVDLVKTSGAIEKFSRWKESHPEDFANFMQRSKAIAENFRAASFGDFHTVLGYFEASRLLGLELGAAITVPAAMAVPQTKALGAGHELGAQLVAKTNTTTVVPAEHGLRIEQAP